MKKASVRKLKVKLVKENARERVGKVPPSKVILDKRKKNRLKRRKKIDYDIFGDTLL